MSNEYSIPYYLADPDDIDPAACSNVAYKRYISTQKTNLVNYDPQPGAKIDHESFSYKIKRYLNGGAFGAVYEVIENETIGESEHLLALKITQGPDREGEFVQIMERNGHHKHIMNYLAGRFKQKIGGVDTHFLSMELMEATLGDVVTRKQNQDIHLTNKVKMMVIKQTADGLAFIHACEIIHTDLKLENILLLRVALKKFKGIIYLEDIHLKIADFGNSLNHPTSRLCTTPQYRAPEIMAGVDLADKRMDLWSLGVLSGNLFHFRFLEVQSVANEGPRMKAAHLYYLEQVVGTKPKRINENVRKEYMIIANDTEEEKMYAVEYITKRDNPSLPYEHKITKLRKILENMKSPMYGEEIRRIIRNLLKAEPEERWSADRVLQFATAALNKNVTCSGV